MVSRRHDQSGTGVDHGRHSAQRLRAGGRRFRTLGTIQKTARRAHGVAEPKAAGAVPCGTGRGEVRGRGDSR